MIKEQIAKDSLLEILADKYSRIILRSLVDMPKSPLEVSAECSIPISTVYRRILDLHRKNLLEAYDSNGGIGKKYSRYRSKIKSIAAIFKNGIVEVEIVPN